MKTYNKIMKSFNKTIEKLTKAGAELNVESDKLEGHAEVLKAEVGKTYVRAGTARKEANRCFETAEKLEKLMEV